jgi:hypothetical protein
MNRDAIDLVVGRESIRYYPAGAVLDGADVPDFNANDEFLARDHPRLRRVLIHLGRSGPLAMMVLHWSDGSDLNTLDERLAAGDTDAGEFANTVAGEFAHHFCSQCESWFRVVDSNSVLTHSLQIPLENVLRHIFPSTCPNCGAPTRRSLLEFLTPPRAEPAASS